MSTTEITQPTRQALAVRERSAKGKVTGRLLRAITEMVWTGARRADAAATAGMTDHSLRAALRKPHVKAFYLQELGILRESERAKTFHRLCDLRDQDTNKNAAVAAANLLERVSDEAIARPLGRQQAPGFVIQVVTMLPQTNTPRAPITIDHQAEPRDAPASE